MWTRVDLKNKAKESRHSYLSDVIFQTRCEGKTGKERERESVKDVFQFVCIVTLELLRCWGGYR